MIIILFTMKVCTSQTDTSTYERQCKTLYLFPYITQNTNYVVSKRTLTTVCELGNDWRMFVACEMWVVYVVVSFLLANRLEILLITI